MENTNYKSDFFTVPRRIIDLPGLQLSFLKVYYEIFRLFNNGLDCFLGNEELMERTGVKSQSTIREALAFFEDKGILQRKIINGKRYIIQPERKIELSTELYNILTNEYRQNDAQGVAKSTGGRRQVDAQGVAKSTHNNNHINNKNINNNSCASNNAHVKNDFDLFWDKYPKKKDRMRAKKLWDKKKYKPETVKLILDDIELRKKNDAQWQVAQYVPFPSTYLNGERWNDEITKPLQQNNNVKPIIKQKDINLSNPIKFWEPGNPDYDRVHEPINKHNPVNKDKRSNKTNTT